MANNDRQPLVSVIVTSYNHRDFIGPAIESVLAQDHGNIEIIVADDRSTDGSAELIRELASEHPDTIIALFQPTNVGITANCNAALSRVTGKYLAFLGSDDLMLPGKLSAQAQVMEADPECVLCYHDLDVFQSETDETLWLFSQRNKPREGSAASLIRYGCFPGACSVMVRRSAAPNSFDARVPFGSDWLYWIQTAMAGRIRYIDRILGRYRRHPTNVTGEGEHYRPLVKDLLATMAIVLVDRPAFLPEVTARTGLILLSFGRRLSGIDRFLTFVGGTLCVGASWLLTLLRFLLQPFGRSPRGTR